MPTGLGTLRLLEAIRFWDAKSKTRFYQASTSELYRTGAGRYRKARPRHSTLRSPTRRAKLYAYWITVNYREAYGMHASNGILFNHESPIRGETFVTRKITRAVASIKQGLQDQSISAISMPGATGARARLCRGNVAHPAADKPDDYVLATGESHSVREFVEELFPT